MATTNLNLGYMSAGSQNKEGTHNDNMDILDALGLHARAVPISIVNGTNNLTSDQASYGFIDLTGTLTGAATVVLPVGTLTKTILRNSTAGGFQVDVQISGQTAYTVAADEAVMIWPTSQIHRFSAGGGSETDTYANRPAAGSDGNLFLPSDGYYLDRDDGAAYDSWGPLYPMTPPVDSNFAWVNQGSATVDDTYGAIHLHSGTAGATDSWRIRKHAIPSAPYIYTMAWVPKWPHMDYVFGGMILRESGSGKFVVFNMITHSAWHTTLPVFQVTKWTNHTTFSADYTLTPAAPTAVMWSMGSCLWFQIEDDNTNRICRISNDGKYWHQVHSVSRTDFCTPDEIGFGINVNNATYNGGMTILSWLET